MPPDGNPPIVATVSLRAVGGGMDIEALDHVGLAVADVDRSVRWYQQVLGLERAYQGVWGDYPAVLEKNGSGVALFPGRGAPVEPATFESLAHVAFRVSRQGYERARAELSAAGIEFTESDHQVAWSIYLLDPDAHLVEITTYEPAPDDAHG
jgi:catechol 2,3-dioxygenase